MTISYAGNFGKLLLRWKGSLFKSVWRELIGFLILYYIVRMVYKLVPMDDKTRKDFEFCCQNFDEYTKRIPLTFLLGFYVSTVVKRWWTQFELIPWPEDLLSLVCLIIPGADRESRLRRHTIARYANLTAALAWRDVSNKVRKRFPTIEHLVRCGLMTDGELALYRETQCETVRWFLPIQWIQRMLSDLIAENKVPAGPLASSLAQELKIYRQSFRKLYCYDWVCIPLVYTQVAALATYAYFGLCAFGRQFLDPAQKYEGYEVDLFVPVFTIIQFLFFVGWFKVGQDLMRPFGTDDDDIELNYILDRHIMASFALVDLVHFQSPALVEDKFWPDSTPNILPHTKISSKISDHPPKLHAFVRLRNEDDGDYLLESLITDQNERRSRKKKWRYF